MLFQLEAICSETGILKRLAEYSIKLSLQQNLT